MKRGFLGPRVPGAAQRETVRCARDHDDLIEMWTPRLRRTTFVLRRARGTLTDMV
jgi:hypothetical protein